MSDLTYCQAGHVAIRFARAGQAQLSVRTDTSVRTTICAGSWIPRRTDVRHNATLGGPKAPADRIMYQWFGRILFPELRQIPSGDQRRDAWRRALKSLPQWPSHVAGATAIVTVGSWAIWFRGSPSYGWLPQLVWPVLIVVSALVTWRYRQRVQRVLRADLNARGSRLCVHCGYDLAHSSGRICPECGSLFFPPPLPPVPASPAPPDTSAPAASHREQRPLPPRLLG
jgi:hypothetical protein